MHQLPKSESGLPPRNRYILPTSLTAIACFFAVLFAGAKIAQMSRSSDSSPIADSFAVAKVTAPH